jgi:hypothetical protein
MVRFPLYSTAAKNDGGGFFLARHRPVNRRPTNAHGPRHRRHRRSGSEQVSGMVGSFTRQLLRPTARSASCLRRDDTSLGPLGFDGALPSISRGLAVGHDGVLRE